MEWYPWFPEAYSQDTMHLSCIQDGAYRRLLDHYMISRAPLPDNAGALARICGLAIAEWEAMSETVKSFFTARNGVLQHKRCNKELEKQDKRSKVLTDKAKKAAAARWLKERDNDASGIGDASTEHSSGIGQASPKQGGPRPDPMLGDARETVRKKEIKEESKTLGLSTDFDRFWKAYPGRGDHPNPKKPALQRFEAAISRGVSAETIVAGAERYRRYVEGEGTKPQHVAQAVTWLNQERWDDAGLPLGSGPASGAADDDDWKEPERRRLKNQILGFRAGRWEQHWGGKPGERACLWQDWLQREELDRMGKAA